MGNCMQTEPNYNLNPSRVSSDSLYDTRQVSLLSRLETIEGTLFLYRSIILRNFLHVQGEVDKLIASHKIGEATFTLKRQKLFETLLKKIEQKMLAVREAMENAEANRRKKDSLKTLSITYALIEDVDNLNKFEDNLKGRKSEDEVMDAFNPLFDKYGIKDNEVKEEIENMEPPFNGIELTESFCVPKREIPNFSSKNELPQMILPRFISNSSLSIQNCASEDSLPNFASNTEIQMPVIIGS